MEVLCYLKLKYIVLVKSFVEISCKNIIIVAVVPAEDAYVQTRCYYCRSLSYWQSGLIGYADASSRQAMATAIADNYIGFLGSLASLEAGPHR